MKKCMTYMTRLLPCRPDSASAWRLGKCFPYLALHEQVFMMHAIGLLMTWQWLHGD